jgi:flavin-binding protein dodecin
MADHVYRVIEIVGTSGSTLENAIDNALERASKTVRNLEWFEVKEVRGMIADGKRVGYYQVDLKIGFRVEE